MFEHIFIGLCLAAVFGARPLASLVIAAIVVNDRDHRDLIARHGPERHGLARASGKRTS